MTGDDPRHGTNAGYVAGCHDKCCAAAKVRYDKIRKFERHSTGRTRRVNSVGYQRRVRALQALGWSYRQLGGRLGVNVSTMSGRMNAAYVYRSTHQAMVRLYDELSMTIPTGMHVMRDRQAAAVKGWAPPLAWNDDTIDDPNAKPAMPEDTDVLDEVLIQRALSGQPVHASRRERAEIARRWHAAGKSLAELDRRNGWNVHRDLRIEAA